MGEDNEPVPLLVQQLAKKQGLTITELHRKTDLSYNTVMAYWHNTARQVSWRVLRELANALGVKPKDLISDE